MNHVMGKLVEAICERQRRRSACASAQSDQRRCSSLPRRYNTHTCYSQKINTVAEQAGLSLTWSETPNTKDGIKYNTAQAKSKEDKTAQTESQENNTAQAESQEDNTAKAISKGTTQHKQKAKRTQHKR